MPVAGSSSAADLDCGPDYWCMHDGTCRKPAGLGVLCGVSLYCRSVAARIANTCRAIPTTVGATCSTSTGLYCDWRKNLMCSGTNCVNLTPRGTGQSCTSSTDHCSKMDTCTNGVCTPGPSDAGGVCQSGSAADCEWPALCIHSTRQTAQSVETRSN